MRYNGATMTGDVWGTSKENIYQELFRDDGIENFATFF